MTEGTLVTNFEKNLFTILSVQRNHGSLGEAEVFSWLVERCVHLHKPVMIDAAGNLHVDLRDGPRHRTMFTSHTDTCHNNSGDEQNPVYLDFDCSTGNTIWRAGHGVCLGADDGAGVALMLHMITHGVKAYYVFFRGEERGGIGSTWLAENMPELLREFDRAIAFDRAGYSDVITHQSGTRCCSDVFAQALADALTADDFSLAYTPEDGGVYTDTAEFVSLIPECTNVSVFYARQHGDMEHLDTTALKLLADTLVLVQWETLPTQRDPRTRESLWGASGSYAWATPPTAAANQTWAALDAYYDEADLDELEPDQFDLLCALEEAREGDTSWLVTLVSDHLLPDGEHTLPLNLNRLDAQLIEDCINMLRQGFAAHMVAGEIHDALRID